MKVRVQGKVFWNSFFIPDRIDYVIQVRVLKQRHRGGSPFKNQFTDNKNQEVVVCVAGIYISLFLAAWEVQPHH